MPQLTKQYFSLISLIVSKSAEELKAYPLGKVKLLKFI